MLGPLAPAGPITGSERFLAVQGGVVVDLDRTQVTTLLAGSGTLPTIPPRLRPSGITGAELIAGLQGGQRVAFTIAQANAVLASSGAVGSVLAWGDPTGLTGSEFLLGVQGGQPIALNRTDAATAGISVGPQAPTVTAISFAYTDTSATDTFAATVGNIIASQSPTSYGITGGSVAGGNSTLVGTYGTLVVVVATGAYTYTPNNTAMNAVESGSPTDAFTITATNGVGPGSAALTVTVNGVAEGGGPSAPIPANYEAVFFGDSRTEDGVTATFTNSAAGFSPSLQNRGHPGWIVQASNGRLRPGLHSNFGIASGNSAQAVLNPRRSAVNTITTGSWWRGAAANSGSDNKGYVQVASHPAGLAVMLLGTNADATYADTFTNVRAIIDAVPGKVWIVCNEFPKGRNPDGSIDGTRLVSSDFKTYQALLNTLDYASGHANARSNVIVADTWGALVDPTSGTNYYNLTGTMRDALHCTPAGARIAADAIAAALDRAWGATWRTTLPSFLSIPTANGLTTATIPNTQPFIHTNPTMTPGTNGSIGGTWATAPLVSDVCQGWTVAVSGTGTANLSCVAQKGVGTGPTGNGIQRLTFSGTLAAGEGPNVTVSQNLQGAALASALAGNTPTSSPRISITDKLRGQALIKVAAGSVGLYELQAYVSMQTTTTNQGQFPASQAGSNLFELAGYGQDSFSGLWLPYQTELIDMQDADITAAGQNVTVLSRIDAQVLIKFKNNTAGPLAINAVVEITDAGTVRVAS